MKTALFIVLLAAMLPWGGLEASEPESSPSPKTGYIVVQGSRTSQPVIVEYKPDLTLMSALGSAELHTVSPARRVRVIRDGTIIIWDFKRLRAHPEEDPKLVPGDVVQIPEAMF